MSSTLDYTQQCILDDIAYLLHRYYLTIDDVTNHVANLNARDEPEVATVDTPIDPVPEPEPTQKKVTWSASPTIVSWDDDDYEDFESIEAIHATIATIEAANQVEVALSSHQKKYTSTRREFRDALSSGLKICPNYSSCSRSRCDRFHINSDNICPHAGKANVCHVPKCDKIIIKGCRKGKHCSEQSCSFRH